MFSKARTGIFNWKSTFQWSVALIGFFLLFSHSIATAAESLKFEVVDKREVQGYQRTKEICQRLLNAVPQKYRSAKKWQLHLISVTGDRNAFATDDGYIAIDYRFLKETDDAIAWVLGHEITHAVLGHGAILEGFKGNLTGFEKTVESLRKLAAPRYQLATKVERYNEDTADSFAFTLVQKAGYNLNNVKDFLQKEAREEGSLKRLAKWMDGSHPTDQERAKVAEERVKPKEKVAQTPPQQPDLAQKGGEQIQKTSEVRTLPGNGFLFLMETDAETGAKFWRYSMDRSKPCWTWRGGMAEVGSYRTPDEAEIICEVPNRISLTDDKLARSLVTKALKMEASKCGLTSPIHIMLVPESYQVTVDKHGFPSFKPVQVDGRYRCDYHFGGYSSSPSKGKVFSGKCDLTNYNNIALAKEQVKLEAKQAASISELGPQKAAEELLAQKITKCGNSHYTKDLDPGGYPLGLYEFKDLSIKITASPLTEADKLNGIEWKGTVILVAKASRPFKAEGFERKPAWQAWENGAKIDHQNISGSLAKRKGRWHLELQIGVMRVNLKPIKCSEISSGS